MFLAANRARGAAMLQPSWAALMQSGDLVAPARMPWLDVRRERFPSNAAGSRFFEGEARLNGGGELRLSRMEIEPSGTEDPVEGYGDIAVPVLAETGGFCCALLLADRSFSSARKV